MPKILDSDIDSPIANLIKRSGTATTTSTTNNSSSSSSKQSAHYSNDTTSEKSDGPFEALVGRHHIVSGGGGNSNSSSSFFSSAYDAKDGSNEGGSSFGSGGAALAVASGMAVPLTQPQPPPPPPQQGQSAFFQSTAGHHQHHRGHRSDGADSGKGGTGNAPGTAPESRVKKYRHQQFSKNIYIGTKNAEKWDTLRNVLLFKNDVEFVSFLLKLAESNCWKKDSPLLNGFHSETLPMKSQGAGSKGARTKPGTRGKPQLQEPLHEDLQQLEQQPQQQQQLHSSSISFGSSKSTSGVGKKTKKVQFNKNVNIIHKLDNRRSGKMVSFSEKTLSDEPSNLSQHDEDSTAVPEEDDGGGGGGVGAAGCDEDDDEEEEEDMEEDDEDEEEEEEEEDEEDEGEDKEAMAGKADEATSENDTVRKVDDFIGDSKEHDTSVGTHDAYLMEDLVKKTMRKTHPPPTNQPQQSNEVQQDSISSTMGSVSEDSLNTETEVLDYRIAEKIKTELEEKQKLERKTHTAEELPTTSNFFDQCDFDPASVDEKPSMPHVKKGTAMERSRSGSALDPSAYGGSGRKRGRRANTADSGNVDLHIEYEEQEYRPIPGTRATDGGPIEKSSFSNQAKQLQLHHAPATQRKTKGAGNTKNKVCTGCSIKHGADLCPLNTPLRAISNKIELNQWLEQNEDLIKKHKLFLKPTGNGEDMDDDMDDHYDEDEDDEDDDVDDEDDDGGDGSRANGKLELSPSFSEVSVPPEFELRLCPQSSASNAISSTTQNEAVQQLQEQQTHTKLNALQDVPLLQQSSTQEPQDQDSMMESKVSLPPPPPPSSSSSSSFAGTIGMERETAPKSRIVSGHGLSIYTTTFIAKYTKIGPLTGQIVRETEIQDDCTMRHIFETFDGVKSTYTSTENKNFSNWLRYIRPARNREQKNCVLQVHDGSIYFVTSKDLEPGTELLYWSNDSNSAWGKKKMEKTNCGGCNLKFDHPFYYRTHCSVFHDPGFSLTIRKYHCKVCGAAVLGKENIMKHAEKLHDGKGAYQCQFCQKFFLRLNYLEMHRTYGCSANPQRTRPLCDFCGRKFCQPQKLKVHIKRMHSDMADVLRDFQCKLCSKLLGSRAALQRHSKEVHSRNSAVVSCPRCQKLFQNRSNLKIHMLTHSGVRPFKCAENECTAAFTTKQCLQFHYKKVHGYTQEQMPKIERSVAYTFDAYSGGLNDGIIDEVQRRQRHKSTASEEGGYPTEKVERKKRSRHLNNFDETSLQHQQQQHQSQLQQQTPELSQGLQQDTSDPTKVTSQQHLQPQSPQHPQLDYPNTPPTSQRLSAHPSTAQQHQLVQVLPNADVLQKDAELHQQKLLRQQQQLSVHQADEQQDTVDQPTGSQMQHHQHEIHTDPQHPSLDDQVMAKADQEEQTMHHHHHHHQQLSRLPSPFSNNLLKTKNILESFNDLCRNESNLSLLSTKITSILNNNLKDIAKVAAIGTSGGSNGGNVEDIRKNIIDQQGLDESRSDRLEDMQHLVHPLPDEQSKANSLNVSQLHRLNISNQLDSSAAAALQYKTNSDDDMKSVTEVDNNFVDMASLASNLKYKEYINGGGNAGLVISKGSKKWISDADQLPGGDGQQGESGVMLSTVTGRDFLTKLIMNGNVNTPPPNVADDEEEDDDNSTILDVVDSNNQNQQSSHSQIQQYTSNFTGLNLPDLPSFQSHAFQGHFNHQTLLGSFYNNTGTGTGRNTINTIPTSASMLVEAALNSVSNIITEAEISTNNNQNQGLNINHIDPGSGTDTASNNVSTNSFNATNIDESVDDMKLLKSHHFSMQLNSISQYSAQSTNDSGILSIRGAASGAVSRPKSREKIAIYEDSEMLNYENQHLNQQLQGTPHKLTSSVDSVRSALSPEQTGDFSYAATPSTSSRQHIVSGSPVRSSSRQIYAEHDLISPASTPSLPRYDFGPTESNFSSARRQDAKTISSLTLESFESNLKDAHHMQQLSSDEDNSIVIAENLSVNAVSTEEKLKLSNASAAAATNSASSAGSSATEFIQHQKYGETGRTIGGSNLPATADMRIKYGNDEMVDFQRNSIGDSSDFQGLDISSYLVQSPPTPAISYSSHHHPDMIRMVSLDLSSNTGSHHSVNNGSHHAVRHASFISSQIQPAEHHRLLAGDQLSASNHRLLVSDPATHLIFEQNNRLLSDATGQPAPPPPPPPRHVVSPTRGFGAYHHHHHHHHHHQVSSTNYHHSMKQNIASPPINQHSSSAAAYHPFPTYY
uniref:Uncharacterized protein n=1 Tax=Anopheles culicifacies TaxID=139723 RepID=A0A182M8Z9_9DIPT